MSENELPLAVRKKIEREERRALQQQSPDPLGDFQRLVAQAQANGEPTILMPLAMAKRALDGIQQVLTNAQSEAAVLSARNATLTAVVQDYIDSTRAASGQIQQYRNMLVERDQEIAELSRELDDMCAAQEQREASMRRFSIDPDLPTMDNEPPEVLLVGTNDAASPEE